MSIDVPCVSPSCDADQRYVFFNFFSRLLTFPLARVYQHTSVLDVVVHPKMPPKKSQVVPEDIGPVPKDACVLLGRTTLEEVRQVVYEALDKALDERTENMRETLQRSASLEQDARQPRLNGGRRNIRHRAS